MLGLLSHRQKVEIMKKYTFLRLSKSSKKRKVLPPASESDDSSMLEMSFLDHLEDLRWTLIKAISGIVVATVICSFFRRWIIDVILMGPTYIDFISYKLLSIDAIDIYLQNRKIPGQFFADWGTVFMVGIVVGSPVVVYQLWRFIEPGLYKTEKKGLRYASVAATFFFTLGILFGYYIITPVALQYFAQYDISTRVVNDFDLTEYFSMVTFWSFSVGVLFELPVVVYFLSKLGILTADRMRTSRRFVLIGVLIIGAFMTPPEPLSQILVAMPLFGLFELSIFVVRFVEKRRRRAETTELGEKGVAMLLLILQHGLWAKRRTVVR